MDSPCQLQPEGNEEPTDKNVETFGYSPWVRWLVLAYCILSLLLSLLFLASTLCLANMIMDDISLLGYSYLANVPGMNRPFLVLNFALSIFFGVMSIKMLRGWRRMIEQYEIDETGITVIAPGRVRQNIGWTSISRIREHAFEKCLNLHTQLLNAPIRIEYQVQRVGRLMELLHRFTPHLRSKENPSRVFCTRRLDAVAMCVFIFFFGRWSLLMFLQFEYFYSVFWIGMCALAAYLLLFKQVRRVEIGPEALSLVRWIGREDLSRAQIESIYFIGNYWGPKIRLNLYEGRTLSFSDIREGTLDLYDCLRRMLPE